VRQLGLLLTFLLVLGACGDDTAATTITASATSSATTTTTTQPSTTAAQPTTAAPGPDTTQADPDSSLLTGEMIAGDIGFGPHSAFASTEAYWIADEAGNELHRFTAIRDPVLRYPLDTMSPLLGSLSAEDIAWRSPANTVLGAFGAVWIQQGDEDHIFRVDVSGRIDRIDLGGVGWYIFAGWNSIWHLSTSHLEEEDLHEGGEPIFMTISRIDPATLTVTATIETPLVYVYDIEFLPDSAWIRGDTWDQPSVLVRIDRATLDIEAWPLEGETGAYGFKAAHGYVWMTGFESGLIRIDPDTGARTALTIGENPTYFAATEDSLWVLVKASSNVSSNDEEHELLRVNPAMGDVEAVIPIGRTSYQVIAVGRDVFVRTLDHDLYIDSLTNSAVEVPLAGFESFAAVADSLWMIDPLDDTVWRYTRNVP